MTCCNYNEKQIAISKYEKSCESNDDRYVCFFRSMFLSSFVCFVFMHYIDMPEKLFYSVLFIIVCATQDFLIFYSKIERLRDLVKFRYLQMIEHRDSIKESFIEVYKRRGFYKKLLEDVVTMISSSKKVFLENILIDLCKMRINDIDHPIIQFAFSLLGGLSGFMVYSLSIFNDYKIFVSAFILFFAMYLGFYFLFFRKFKFRSTFYISSMYLFIIYLPSGIFK